ncbi:MAG: Txe/YoeB family addiction module toxin [Saprospiraceae bacterium]|nr:Txe/YoeB family addiction module toxin [Saprospiraceae bacterium]
MNVEFTPIAWEDFNYWITFDKTKVEKINELICSIKQSPFKGIGSSELLRHELQGFWSRRIHYEHRLVYRVVGAQEKDHKILIIQCRYHYHHK